MSNRTFYQIWVDPLRGKPFNDRLPFTTREAAISTAEKMFDPRRHYEVVVLIKGTDLVAARVDADGTTLHNEGV